MIRVAQNDMLATNLLTSIHEVELQLLKSYNQYPQGRNAKVDALRQRVQNVVDIERVMANQYSAAFGGIIDNDGLPEIENGMNQIVGGPGPQATATPFPSELAPTPPPPPDEPASAIPNAAADTDPKLTGVVPRVLQCAASNTPGSRSCRA